MKKIFYIFVFVLHCFSQGAAQNIDSLILALKNAKYDTTRCNILNVIIEVENDDEIWSIYNEQLRVLAEKNTKTNTPLKAFYLNHLADALNNIGFLAQANGDNARAIEYWHKSLRLQEELKDVQGIAASLNNFGYIYHNQGDIPRALEFYHRSLRLQEQIKDKKGIALSLNSIGFIYSNQGDASKALEYYYKSLKFKEEIKDKVGISNSLNNIGLIYFNRGELPKALDYWQKCLKLQEEIKYKRGVALSLNNIGAIYDDQGDLPKALNYYHRSLKIQEEIIDKMGMAKSLNNIAEAMMKRGDVHGAQIYAKRSLQAANKLGYPMDIKGSAIVLKNIYKKQNKYKAAFEMYELEIKMRDSINNEVTKKASIQKQFQYEYEKKAAADSVVFAKENEIKEVEIARQKAEIKVKKNQQMALYGGLVLVLVFAGFMYNRFKVTQKQKTVIEQQKTVVEKAHLLLEEKNSEIIASIRYAKRIQDALLTSQKYMERSIDRLKSTNKN